MISAHDKLLSEIEAFLLKHDLAAATFGRFALGDPKFVKRFRAGATCTLPTLDLLNKFMADYPNHEPPPPSKRSASQSASP